jgi:glucose/arabinose dehydrogenase
MRDAFPRRRSFPLALAFLAALCAPVASAAVTWNKVYSGFSSPLEITHAHDGRQRLFVVEQSGKIRIIRGGSVPPAPFIDLGLAGLDVIASGGERGLLGIAFHPQYATNRRFYVNYTRKSDGATVIARYLASAGNADVADPASGTTLLTIAQPEANHNGGAIKFGSDGFLYIGMGDGGGGNDQHGAIGNGQDKSTLLGKILRIDVDNGGANPYAIPPGNPYASGIGGRSEIFAIGVRNPWRMSFDRATGDFWFGDVGQGAVEEVDMLPAGTGAGTNFGWRIMEGTSCTGLASPPIPCNDVSLKPPVVEYTHALGCSVTGGYVYRGSAVPALIGQYLYGDFCSGRIWAAQRVGSGPWTTAQLGATGYAISTFGEDEAGELYFANHATGDIYQFADSAPPPPPPASDVVDVIEYYHAGLDHYFITPLPAQIAALDAGQFSGWARTHESFKAWSTRQVETRPVCRYYIPPSVGDSHFFSASPTECALAPVLFPSFVLESPEVMHEALPDAANGACPVDTTPIYRVWNKRPDSNHRYLTNRAMRDAMVARGYVAEGYGPDAVAMCGP